METHVSTNPRAHKKTKKQIVLTLEERVALLERKVEQLESGIRQAHSANTAALYVANLSR
jgi:cob(I)alamin adenosyltransferase